MSRQLELLIGGPGAGKTHRAIEIARGGIESLADYQQVLFLSFTRIGIRHLQVRVSGLSPRLRTRIMATTFHGLYYRLLVSYGYLVGLPTSELHPCDDAELNRFPESTERRSYDQIEAAVLELIARAPLLGSALRDRFPLVVVDEFQDVSAIQWDFLELISSERLVLLGDPDQDINPRRVPFDPFSAAMAVGARVEQLDHSVRDPTMLIPRLARAVLENEGVEEAVMALRRSGRFATKRHSRANAVRSGVYWTIRKHQQAHAGHTIGVLAHSGNMSRQIDAYLAAGPSAAPAGSKPSGVRTQLASLADGYSALDVLYVTALAACFEASISDEELREAAVVTCLGLDAADDVDALLNVDKKSKWTRALTRLRSPAGDLAAAEDRANTLVRALPLMAHVSYERTWTSRRRRVFARVKSAVSAGSSWKDVRRRVAVEHRFLTVGGGVVAAAVEVSHFAGCKGREYDAVILHFDGRDIFKQKHLGREKRRILYVAISRASKFLYVHGVEGSMGDLVDRLFPQSG